MIKPRLTAAALAALCSAGILIGSGTPAKSETLIYATFYGTNEFYESSAKWFMEEITSRTNGDLTFETYYSGSLLRPADISQGISRGVADVGVSVPAAFNPREFPLTGVVLPFVSENPMAVTAAFQELFETTPQLKGEFDRNNQKLLWALASGENSMWTNKPIRNLEDLQGARIRSVLGVADALRELGATPVTVPWVEALELMQRGGVEGVSATPFNQASVAGTLDVATHASNAGRMGVYAVVLWAMNLDTWNGLSPEHKEIVEQVASEVPSWYFTHYDAEVDRALEAVKASAVEYVHLDDAEVVRWQEIARPVVHGNWAVMARGHGIEPEELMERFMQLVEKHSADEPYTPGFDRMQ